ncbi:MAG TPA: efflux RND transporter periplasmic adaptor subunit [Candidatus Aminicenantes bacterium]|nr:efflux RND transporter periplasmic adaptor subunit [Candidatus Aminicenantes bacterium]
MKGKLTSLLVLFMVLLPAGCGHPPAPRAVAPAGEGAAEGKTTRELSDLDRPAAELFALTCEHGRKTFECAECRYEAGVVRVPASLCQDGLVRTAPVGRQRLTTPVVLTGEVAFDERRVGHVGSQVEGVIQRVLVTLGERVRRGQPLVEIGSIAAGEAQSAYLEAQGMLWLARRNFARAEELHREAISSEKEYLLAKREFEAAGIQAASALGRLQRLGMDPGGIRAPAGGGAQGVLTLRAPQSGAVLALHAVPGEVARPEESLLTIGDNGTVWVWAHLTEQDIAAVSRGQAAGRLAAAIAVKAYPGETFAGVVDLVSPAMDEPSRTVKVRVEAGNPDGRLLAGMFATVTVFLPGTGEVLAVPRDALLDDEGRTFVFVHHHDDYYLRRPVRVGRLWADWAEIRQGLRPGQTVVAEGSFLLKSDVLRAKMGAGCAD